MSSIEPAPKVAAIARSRSTASDSSRFPIVDPGKKPSRAMPSIASGSPDVPVKSPSIGNIGKSGNAAESAATDSLRNSAEMSIGT